MLFVEKSHQENEGPSAALGKPPDIETQPTIVQGPSAAISKPPDVESQPTIVQQSTERKENDTKPESETKKIVNQSQPNKIPVKGVMADNSDNHEPAGRFTIFFEITVHTCMHTCLSLHKTLH